MTEEEDFWLVPVRGMYDMVYGYSAKVSLEDYDMLSQYKWRWTSAGYVVSSDEVLMSRLILDAGPDELADHIHGDTSDHRRSQLRILTRKGNGQNKSKRKRTSSTYHGVSRDKRRNEFRVRVDYKYLGVFKDEVEAAEVYDRYVVHNNTYHKLNFPERRAEWAAMPPPEIRQRKKNKVGFLGVSQRGSTYSTLCCGEYLGSFGTKEEAARAYDTYIVENQLYGRELNYPEDNADFVATRAVKTVMHEIDGTEQGFKDVDAERDGKIYVHGHVVLIEKADYEEFIKYNTIGLERSYPVIFPNGGLHRIIMREENPTNYVDHVDNNTFDVRRRKLRITDAIGNARNQKKRKNTSSNYIGVSKQPKSWRMTVGDKYLGVRYTEEDAARHRDLHIIDNYPPGNTWKLNYVWTDEDKNFWRAKLFPTD